MKFYLNTAAILATFIVGTAPANAQTFPHAALGRQVLENHIRPTFSKLAMSFAELRRATHSACSDGSATSAELAAIDGAYRNAVLAWSKASHLRFGPMTEKNRYERIAFWPDRKGRGRKQVRRLLQRGTRDISTQFDATTLSGKSVALQGLTALEVVLYGTRRNGTRVDALDQFPCAYASAIAERLTQTALAIHSSWKKNGKWAKLWLKPRADNPAYLTQIEVTREFANAFLHGMRDLRERHLVAPLGFVKKRLGRVYRPVFAASGLSTTYLRGGVLGLAHLYENGGIAQTLKKFDSLHARRVEWQFREIRKAARELDAAPTADFSTESVREPAVAMGFPLKSIMLYVSTMLAQHASLSLGFNASDGD